MPLGNCLKCGTVFSRTNNPLCPQCAQKEEADFQAAVRWLRDNPGRNVTTLSKATNIEEADILRWIRQKRLSMKEVSESVKCNSCGKPITTGTLCDRCKLRMSQEVNEELKTLKSQIEKENMAQRRGMHYRPDERRKEIKP
ncbi:hypothetical protein HZA56_02785 [Candidatus Poribacteria bacterium]|nr:hypothetical protein [Candidatus Poribacteria bacterium]